MTNTDNEKARMLALSELAFYRSMLYSVEASFDTLLSLRYDLEQDGTDVNARALSIVGAYIAHERRRLEEWQGKAEAYNNIVKTLS
jgi:hypothetical protein